jgi:glyoxylase-like metal-dependent hydrolase (beta-lactamase superfamily II)
MTRVQDVDEIAPGVHVWHLYDPSVKAELYSTALETRSGTYIIDPVPLDSGLLLQFGTNRTIAGIAVTNANHSRAAAEFAESFSAPLYVCHDLCGPPDFLEATGVKEGMTINETLTGIRIEGGPDGEMAFHCEERGGTMILGDALINFNPNGLEFLPARYCRDNRLMRRSLRKLLDYRFERMLFGHGIPILSGARNRLEQLLTAR